ncbi:Asp23/Gls24 family envelope stress response protein [Nocardia callitridis]|uniref:Asp23/Gls24 family envelope stress response protein n=1 Tax=Nocardia callitridis TaxID=648753 RepID=A0ABP9KMA2_9NOCA
MTAVAADPGDLTRLGAADAEGAGAAGPGSTTVAPKAVRRIAAQVVREVAGVDRDVRVQAHVSGQRAVLEVRLPIEYPKPVDRVTEACRAHLADRLAALTGMTVARIDIEVSALTTVGPTRVVESRVR